MSPVSEFVLFLISFAASDSTSALFVIPSVNFKLDWDGIKEREDGQRGLEGRGGLFEGGEWKSFFILMQIKLIFTRKVVHLASLKVRVFGTRKEPILLFPETI